MIQPSNEVRRLEFEEQTLSIKSIHVKNCQINSCQTLSIINESIKSC